MLAAVAATPAAAAPQACDPWTASFRGDVPTAKQVIGIDLGERDATTAESDAYLLAVDRASRRVTSGVLAHSVQGRPLRYAIVGDDVSKRALKDVRRSAAELMDPRTSDREAARIAARDPAILWIAGNVHGGEESGTDAALRTLYELADRDDCAARRIRKAAVVVILPIQNPDGREADSRRNAYGFDMNRDWFARTQPETDGKVEFLRRYPGVLFIDAHEMGNTGGYFFPPNADPIFHEIHDDAVDWIDDVYGAAMQDEFSRRGIPFFNYSVYDLFYAGYGDTVPANGFGAAGMTFEKTSSHPAPRRVFEQYVTQWLSLTQAARNKERILREWHRSWVDAVRQGEAGRLEPNMVVEPGNTVEQPVPDIRVRHYFLRADEPGKEREVRALVRRLQRMDVEVRRLARPLRVDDFTPYGRSARATTLPAGTYWVPMAQRQKHWIQALLTESTYTPVGYAYDIVSWSNPLLFNVAGGYSGERLAPRSQRVPPLREPGYEPIRRAPRVALYSMSPQFSRGIESSGWLRWLLDRWRLPFDDVTAADIAAGALDDYDTLLVPDGYALQDPDAPDDPYGYADLGEAGRAALAGWVRDGGRYVGWSDGAVLAAALGISSAEITTGDSEGFSTPGSLLRVATDRDSPLADGVGAFAWATHLGDYVMRSPDPDAVALRYPPAGSEDFFVSGQAEGAEALAGTAAVLDERVGSGRTVAFAFDPNFRAFSDGTQKVLRNAILGPPPRARVAARASAAARGRAAAAARRLRVSRAPVRLEVRPRGERAARRLVEAQGARYRVVRARGRVTFLIANPADAIGDEHPFARRLAAELRSKEVPVVLYRAP
jgi:hypothetical protein